MPRTSILKGEDVNEQELYIFFYGCALIGLLAQGQKGAQLYEDAREIATAATVDTIFPRTAASHDRPTTSDNPPAEKP